MEVQWALVLFTVVSGTGAWLFAWSSIQALARRGELPAKTEAVIAFVLLVVGGCLSVLHLKHVDRIFEALNHPTSGIFVEAAMIGVMCVIVAVYFILLVRNSSEGARKAVAVIGAVVGIVFSFACGASYMMEARAAWMTYMLPLGYCATAAAAGAGLNALTKALAKADEDALSFAGLLAIVGGVVALVVCAVFCVQTGSYIAENGAAAWVVVLFVALVVTVAGGAYLYKKPSGALGVSAAVLAAGVIGAIGLRVAMWLVGTPLMDFFLMPLD